MFLVRGRRVPSGWGVCCRLYEALGWGGGGHSTLTGDTLRVLSTLEEVPHSLQSGRVAAGAAKARGGEAVWITAL